MSTKTRLGAVAIAIAIGAAISGGASAADDTFYIGGAWGGARPSFDSANVTSGVGTNFNAKSSYMRPLKIYGGLKLSKNFSIEGTWLNLGSFDSNTGNTLEMTGWGMSLVGYLPVTKDLSLLGRLGENRMTLKNITNNASDTTWSPVLGVGLKYDLNPNIGVRWEVERISKMGSNTTTIKTDTNLYTVGLDYQF